ncbi:hypothetical protein [Roseovarius indicus]|uniref:Resolvase/invertase-type recombinase catalytic domain-containing protein n=1 Tax=Roseovarius indicus TaxID=540747 RepID=A0A0T5P8Y9_9RHOB|nr:hypothetical protein [Roseovarius indicus]KRS17549.1 hypothetical protein XM52_13830 [Roseovarius indicus]QEW26757.1 hypothetical protein RIdsm_02559 [Roseovarius indicus]SFD60555.1 hypothetical protein SAMN04488031_101784 [Roseovarius indicus]
MRVGYGYKCTDNDFAAADVETIWIDHPGSERMERTVMLQHGLREGDTLVLLRASDLGVGGELPNIRRELERRNVKVETVPTDAKQEKPKRPVGNPGKFHLSDEDMPKAEKLWHGLQWSGPYVLRRVREMSGFKGTDRQLRNALNYRFGPRDKNQD